MKKIIVRLVLFLTIISLTGCDKSSSEKEETQKRVLTFKALGKLYGDYRPFIQKNLIYRVEALNAFDELKEHDPLTGADHDSINALLLNYLSTKERLNELIEKYQYLVDDNDGYDPKDRLELIMMSLSAMLIRYDNYLVAYSNYENHDKLRDRFNEKTYNIPKNTLKDMTKTYNSLSERLAIKKMIDFYNEHIGKFEDNEEMLFDFMKKIIEQSPSFKLGFEDNTGYSIANLRTLYTHTVDLGDLGLSNLTNELSKGFGNSAGLVETRKGKLYDNEHITSHIASHLRAGDILLEKTPFRLTDKLIPGHWGHAAVYIGTVQELKDLGIWNHALVVKYREEIEDNKLIAEALRDGVQLNSLEHFLNIDDFATMQDTQESDSHRASRILRTLKQLGKEYDFNFDIETADKIVCSELIYITSTEVEWETEKVAGVHTISPDNVARKSIEEGAGFTITLLYHDGEEITSQKKEMMQLLLE